MRTAGDRYQWLVAWGACVDALHDAETGVDNPVLSVGVEVDGAGNLDDVVLYRDHPPHSYKQVKYSVDSASPINTAFLSRPSRSGGPSILRKIADAQCKLGSKGNEVDLVLVTNRVADPDDALVTGRDSRTQLLLPNAAQHGPHSAAAKLLSRWADAAGLTEAGLLDLLSRLRFDLGRDVGHLEDLVIRTMLLTGLRGDDDALSLGIGWVQDQVIAGQRKLDLDAIRQAVDDRRLHNAQARVVVSVATLAPDPLAARALHSLDWVDRFDGANAYVKRRPKPPATWQGLQAEIEQIPGHLGGATRVAVTGSMRLAVAFTVGASLRMVTGVDVATVQRGELWSSDASFTSPNLPEVTELAIDQGADIAIAVEVATPIMEDVQTFVREANLPVRALVGISPVGGPRDIAVPGPSEACALAVGIRNVARQAARGQTRIHLFLGCPMGLALLLGHRWNRVAPTIVYEDLAYLGYQAAFSVSA